MKVVKKVSSFSEEVSFDSDKAVETHSIGQSRTTVDNMKWSNESKETTPKLRILTPTKKMNFLESGDQWSSISSKNSEFFLDDRKQLRKRKSTDKRLNMVLNILKRHYRARVNKTEATTIFTWFPRSRYGISTMPIERRTRPRISLKVTRKTIHLPGICI